MDDQRDYAEEAYNRASLREEENPDDTTIWVGRDLNGNEWRILADGDVCQLEYLNDGIWATVNKGTKDHVMGLGEYIGILWRKP